MSSKWGFSSWGLSSWGYSQFAGQSSPQIVQKAPLPNAVDVPEDAGVSVWFFDKDYNLDTSTVLITINGSTAYSGTGGFGLGYTGIVTYSAGSLIIQLIKLDGWAYGETVTVSASVFDTTALSVSDTWSWRVKENPICYNGAAPLPIELKIQQPMTKFLNLELPRKVILDSVLNLNKVVTLQGNKAARVVYQLGFSTELNTILNAYKLRNDEALKTTVCERANILVIDNALNKIRSDIQKGMQDLYNYRALPQEYIISFNNYLDSTLPSYRVSVVANMVLFARAYETQSGQ
jgi:hypothetical protein